MMKIKRKGFWCLSDSNYEKVLSVCMRVSILLTANHPHFIFTYCQLLLFLLRSDDLWIYFMRPESRTHLFRTTPVPEESAKKKNHRKGVYLTEKKE